MQPQQHHHQQQQQQLAATFPTPEGRYTLVSERQSNGIPFAPLRTTKLTLAALSGNGRDATYLVYNVAENLYVSQAHLGGKDAIRMISFGSANQSAVAIPTSHSHLQTSDGFDLAIGLSNGEIVVGSLQLQLQTSMGNAKLLNSQHYNPDGVIDGSRVTQVEWSRQSEGQMFVVAHASGALYLYAKVQSLPEVDNSQLVGPSPIKTLKNSPVGNIPINGGAINGFSFSPDGTRLATVTSDGILRVFEFPSGPLLTGFKSYYGGLLCVAWSEDGRYIAAGGEDDLVAVFGLREERVIVWGEGHNSWVSAVAFDPVMTELSHGGTGRPAGPSCYRIGSVGQDSQVLLWDVVVEDEAPGGSAANTLDYDNPAHLKAAQSAPVSPPRGTTGRHSGTITPSVPQREMVFMPPVTQNRWHAEPMSDIMFTPGALATSCHGGQVKVWRRPSPQDGTAAQR